MPRTTGVDILSIRPDSDLGLAQGVSVPIPVVAPVELDRVNKANDDMRVYDHQINLMKYQRKMQQKDKLLQALENDQVAVGDIEPEDKKYFDEAEQRARKAFLAVKSIEPDENGQNKEFEEYKSSVQDLKDRQKILNLRRVDLQALRKELAATVSPAERKAREAHLAKMKAQSPYETVTPYQKSLTVDMDKTFAELQQGALISDDGEPTNVPQRTTTVKDANGKITTTTTEKPAAGTKLPTKTSASVATQPGVRADGYLNTEVLLEAGKKWSLPVMTKRANQLYLDPSGEGFAQIQGTFDVFQGNPDNVPKAYLKQMNERLADFHTQNEIGSIKIPDKRTGPVNPNNPNDTVGGLIDSGEYPHQINYRILEDGRIAIEDNPADFAAKLALANVAGEYVIKPKKGLSMDAAKFNLEVDKYKADLMNDKGKLAVEWGKLGLEKAKFNADNTNHEDFASAASIINEATSIINKGEPIKLDLGAGKTATSIRISDPTLLNTFGNIDKNGTVTNVPDVINYDKDKNQAVLVYYEKEKTNAATVGETKKTASGKRIVEKEIPVDQRTWLKHIAKRSFPNKDIGKINTIVDDVLEKNDNSLYKIAEKNKPAGGSYSWNGYDYSEDEIKQAAAAEKLTQDAYMKKHGIKKK